MTELAWLHAGPSAQTGPSLAPVTDQQLSWQGFQAPPASSQPDSIGSATGSALIQNLLNPSGSAILQSRPLDGASAQQQQQQPIGMSAPFSFDPGVGGFSMGAPSSGRGQYKAGHIAHVHM